MTRTATEIGVQFDSLADVLTFGIAPIALIYSWSIAATFGENSPAHGLGIFLLFMYLMCGAFRLARFNLQATRPRVLIEGTPKIDKKKLCRSADSARRRTARFNRSFLADAAQRLRRRNGKFLQYSGDDFAGGPRRFDGQHDSLHEL